MKLFKYSFVFLVALGALVSVGSPFISQAIPESSEGYLEEISSDNASLSRSFSFSVLNATCKDERLGEGVAGPFYESFNLATRFTELDGSPFLGGVSAINWSNPSFPSTRGTPVITFYATLPSDIANGSHTISAQGTLSGRCYNGFDSGTPSDYTVTQWVITDSVEIVVDRPVAQETGTLQFVAQTTNGGGSGTNVSMEIVSAPPGYTGPTTASDGIGGGATTISSSAAAGGYRARFLQSITDSGGLVYSLKGLPDTVEDINLSAGETKSFVATYDPPKLNLDAVYTTSECFASKPVWQPMGADAGSVTFKIRNPNSYLLNLTPDSYNVSVAGTYSVEDVSSSNSAYTLCDYSPSSATFGGTQNITAYFSTYQAPPPPPPPTPLSCNSFTATPTSGTAPLSVSMSIIAGDGSGGYTYSFNGGAFQSSPTIEYTYNVAGSYTATGMVRDSSGATASCSSVPITVYGDTYVITPYIASTGSCSQTFFRGLYDPDGPSGPSGNIDVTNSASWTSSNPTIAVSLGYGVFEGRNDGVVDVWSSYRGIDASAQFDVSGCDVGGDPLSFVADIWSNYDSILRGNPVTLSWMTDPAADSCTAVSGAGFDTGGYPGSPKPGSDEVSPLQGPTTYTARCAKEAESTDVSKDVRIFYHELNIDAALYSGDCTGNLSALGGGASAIVQKTSPAETATYTFSTGSQDIWGAMPATYSIQSASAGAQYKYCNASAPVTFSSITEPQTRTLTAYFALAGDGPSVNLASSPDTICAGDDSLLEWTSSGVVSCSTNFGESSLSGSKSVSPVTDTTYTITCQSASGETVSDSAQVNISPDSACGSSFACSLSSTPDAGSFVILTTDIQNGSENYSCLVDYGDGTSDPIYGDCEPRRHLYTQGTYTATADVRDTSTGQETSCSTQVGGSGDVGGGAQANIEFLFYEKNPQTQQWNRIYNWSQLNVPEGAPIYHCVDSTANGFEERCFSAWGGRSTPIDEKILDAQAGNYWLEWETPDWFSVDIVYNGDPSANTLLVEPNQERFITYYVSTYLDDALPDSCTIQADPTSILWGQSSQVSWSCANPEGKTCTIDQGIGSADPNGGTATVKPKTNTTYTLQCSGVPDATATVRVGFLPLLREIIPR